MRRRLHVKVLSRSQVIAVRCPRWLRGGSGRLDATSQFFQKNMGAMPCGQPSRASCNKNRGETMRGERDIAVRSFKGRQIAGGGARRGEASNDKSCENSCSISSSSRHLIEPRHPYHSSLNAPENHVLRPSPRRIRIPVLGVKFIGKKSCSVRGPRDGRGEATPAPSRL